jgi:hypothetical protein
VLQRKQGDTSLERMILFLFPATKHDCCFLLPHPNMSIHHSSIYPLPQKSLLLALGHHPRNDEEKKITMEEKKQLNDSYHHRFSSPICVPALPRED